MSLKWQDCPNGIHSLTVIKAFVTCYVIELDGGACMVRINGKEVKKTYPSVAVAKQVAVKAVEKLLLEATHCLN